MPKMILSLTLYVVMLTLTHYRNMIQKGERERERQFHPKGRAMRIKARFSAVLEFLGQCSTNTQKRHVGATQHIGETAAAQQKQLPHQKLCPAATRCVR